MTAWHQLLRRRTNSLAFIPEIDGFRFLAIASVVLFHICEFLQYRVFNDDLAFCERSVLFHGLKQGFYGVELFFVISGFVLSFPFLMACAGLRKPVALREYFLRRVTRLEPPYILNLTLLLPLYALYKGYELSYLLPHYAARLFYAHNIAYFPDKDLLSLITPVAWSLEIEIQFYVLVPVLAGVFWIRKAWPRRLAIVGIGAAGVLAQALLLEGRFPATIFKFIQYFVMGFLLADIYINDWKQAPTKHWVGDVACLGALGLMMWSAKSGGLTAETLFPVAVFLLYTALFRGRFLNVGITNRWLTAVGGMCYTIYLYHYQVIQLLGPRVNARLGSASFTTHMVVSAVVLIPAVLAVATLLFLLVEKPCMNKNWPSDLRAWVVSRWRGGKA